jgi:hypothetical protein
MTASDRTAVPGMHLPFPGYGHVVREQGRYRYEAAFWAHEV